MAFLRALAAFLPFVAIVAQADSCSTFPHQLETIADVDQAYRQHLSSLVDPNGRVPPRAFEHGLLIDSTNTARLKSLIAACGWPTISRFGEQSDRHAWLIAQHADQDRSFQRRVLRLLHDLLPGETAPFHLAYLSDRLSVADGKPQLYGTQLIGTNNCNLELLPMDSIDAVNVRRERIGLPPVQEYLKRVRQEFASSLCHDD